MKTSTLIPIDWKHPGHWCGLIVLLLQLTAVIHARFVPERFFCWAPYDEHTRYRISVEIDGEALSGAGIRDRYRYADQGWEVRSIHNLISFVRQYQETYGASDAATVTLTYRINGREESQWTWPRP